MKQIDSKSKGELIMVAGILQDISENTIDKEASVYLNETIKLLCKIISRTRINQGEMHDIFDRVKVDETINKILYHL